MSFFRFPEFARPITARALFAVAAITALAAVGAGASVLPPGLIGPEMAQVEIPIVTMASVDQQALLAEDNAKPTGPESARPLRLAVGLDASINTTNSGRWDRLADGWNLWRVEIHAPGAENLNLRLDDLNLPNGSKMWLHDPSGSQVHGPYSQADRDRRGGLSTPIVTGDRVVVEVITPPGHTDDVEALISRVHHGYRNFGNENAPAKQGSCNIDVICPEGDDWREQIRSVALYTIQSGGNTYSCTGTLMNNTAEDDRPLFLTADHCLVRDDNDHTMVVYWNYESPNCGDLSGGSLSQNQTGSNFLATWDWNTGSDFTIVTLTETPDPAFNVFYAGWDATGTIPQAAVGIHHPSGDEKAISFEDDPLGTIWNTHWKVNDWDLGTTEQGSSGSCLFDPSNGLCVGTLSGGYAACGNDDEDWYGKVSESWTGGGTASSRLSDYLDPLALGAMTLEGKDPSGSGSTTHWLIPAAASTAGVGTSNWKTQVGVANPSNGTVTATLFFVAKGSAWPGVMLPGTYSIPAGGALYIDDPLASSNPTSGLMYVSVSSSEAVVSTRTYNLGDNGATFGQGIPGIPLDTAEDAPSVVLPLIQNIPNRFRTNVGIVQTSAGSLLIRVIIRAPSGAVLATKTFAQTDAYNQINDIFGNMGIGGQSVEGAWIEVELIGGSPSYWTAYASVVDEQTGDPTYVAAVVR